MIESRFDHTLSVLPGNLRCLTVPIPTARSITLLVLVKVGSRYETKNDNGISHFMEHMFFKGAERYPDTMAVAGAIDGAGGNFNAFTGEEMVGYYVKISSAKKEVAYDLLSDMLLNSKFDEEEIKRESGVIVEEIRMHHDDPMSLVYQDFQTLFFGDQPLGWDIAGTEKNVMGMTRKNFTDHHKEFYSGKNCVVTCAGDINAKEHEELCAKYFTFDDGGTENEAPPFKKIETDKIHFRKKKTEQAHFMFGFYSSPADHKDIPAIKVLNGILGGSMSSRLFYQIRERRGLAYYISSSFSTYSDTGLFHINAGVNLSKVDEALKCALEEVDKIRSSPVTEEEIERAKQNIKGNADLALEDSRRVANFYGLRESLYRKIKTPEMLHEEIDAVTIDDISRIAKEHFIDSEMKLALIAPDGDKAKFADIFKLG